MVYIFSCNKEGFHPTGIACYICCRKLIPSRHSGGRKSILNSPPLCLFSRDILFGRIYERFSMDMIAMGTFLECLEPYILNDRLRVMPPVVMKDFVTHYEQKSMLESVEACIVHMDVSSLDIHHVSLARGGWVKIKGFRLLRYLLAHQPSNCFILLNIYSLKFKV